VIEGQLGRSEADGRALNDQIRFAERRLGAQRRGLRRPSLRADESGERVGPGGGAVHDRDVLRESGQRPERGPRRSTRADDRGAAPRRIDVRRPQGAQKAGRVGVVPDQLRAPPHDAIRRADARGPGIAPVHAPGDSSLLR